MWAFLCRKKHKVVSLYIKFTWELEKYDPDKIWINTCYMQEIRWKCYLKKKKKKKGCLLILKRSSPQGLLFPPGEVATCGSQASWSEAYLK